MLGVNNELHMLSMRRGLQLMRQLNFNLNRLCRRPTGRPTKNGNTGLQRSRSNGSPDDILQTSPEVPANMLESAHSTPALRMTQSPTFKSNATIHR